jgi:antitoxin (DNA-binding transcriptional repressor) of toxin-antitoxin stability system
MIKLNIHEAKTHLSRVLAQLDEHEVIVLCNRNVPVAEIRPLPKHGKQPRKIGFMKGQLSVPQSFFEPLSNEILDDFDGVGGGGTGPEDST